MDVGTAIALVSLLIAIFALVAAVAQVNIQASVEARRKGKTDKLALGDWAISWPQARNIIFAIFTWIHLPSPIDDPKVLTVPFITVGALEDCLRNEAQSEKRGLIDRRMKSRLVESATRSIATGSGKFSGRMYAVRATTRKRSEACWADAMDMCGITRKHWPLLTGASALACDGAIRPANAVTNLHSLWGFARTMGLRSVEINRTRITMTNGGASIYLDQYAGVDRPTRLAHFSGSPNGRYNILEEMSQHTAESVYSDAVWSDGCVPIPPRLESKYSPESNKDIGRRRIAWPCNIHPPSLDFEDEESELKFSVWAKEFLGVYRALSGLEPTPEYTTYIKLIDETEPAIVSCIRTYPKNKLSTEEKKASRTALAWCMNHWWLDPRQSQWIHENAGKNISSEFITCRAQANQWCHAVNSSKFISVDAGCWGRCKAFSQLALEQQNDASLHQADKVILVKILQGWKLRTICVKLAGGSSRPNSCAAKAEILLISMALLEIAIDNSSMGSSEANKALEIELG